MRVCIQLLEHFALSVDSQRAQMLNRLIDFEGNYAFGKITRQQVDRTRHQRIIEIVVCAVVPAIHQTRLRAKIQFPLQTDN